MITSVTLKNYKAHRDTTIGLGRFTVLVGPNGSGKTSVLEAIDRADRAFVRDLPEEVFPSKDGRPRSYHRSGIGALELALQMQVDGGERSRRISWTPSTRWTHEVMGFPLDRLPNRSATFYRLEPRLLSSPSESRQERPFLEPDGRNLGDVLAALKVVDDPVLDRITAALRTVVPSVERILIRRRKFEPSELQSRIDPPVGQQVVLDFEGAPDVAADDISEGTLVTLALLTAICSGPRPHAVLIDDLGMSLHPTAQMILVRQLHRLLDDMPDVQIVATTHSAYILDEMKPEDIVAFARRPDGSIASKRLSEHPSVKMRGYVTTGELWGLGDESTWVL